MKVLIFAGAGASVELGVPAMQGMAIEFLSHAKQWNIDPGLVEKMMGNTLDIEHLIENLDQLCEARYSIEVVGGETDSIDRANTVRSEVEWFVQHSAERVVPRDAALMWGSVLRSAQEHELEFVTTNYDRAIELAANAVGVSLFDGFEGFGQNETAPWRSFARVTNAPPLVKLHGSTDWYAHSTSGEPLKLRHPMPLFGRGTLSLSNGVTLGSALVLPSREKFLSKPPYPRLLQAFLNFADQCEAAVFVGTSLRDNHISEAASDIARTRPTFIVNPEGNTYGIQNAKPITQSASKFLISTLPRALTDNNPPSILAASVSNPEKEAKGILAFVRTATDAQADTKLRCEAIEALDSQSICLDDHFVRSFLADADQTVARYALALVATSVGNETLRVARECPHLRDSAFAEELALLEKMMQDETENTPS